MKKKLLILSASISLLLACFPFTLCAEEDPESDLGISSPPAYYELDDYFYDNYILLPYIENTSSNYFNTGVGTSNNLKVSCILSELQLSEDWVNIYGSLNLSPASNRYYVEVQQVNDEIRLGFATGSGVFNYSFPYYSINSVVIDKNELYINNNRVGSRPDSDFIGPNIFLFCRNGGGSPMGYSQYKLHNFSVYDYDNEEYLCYLYPAQARSGESVGLYDAVSKTFLSPLGTGTINTMDTSNEASVGIMTSIYYALQMALSSIGDILVFAINEPIIIMFMAIGLAGAMFRWGRRLVHF